MIMLFVNTKKYSTKPRSMSHISCSARLIFAQTPGLPLDFEKYTTRKQRNCEIQSVIKNVADVLMF